MPSLSSLAALSFASPAGASSQPWISKYGRGTSPKDLLVWMADVLRAERHFVVANFVLAFDKLQQLLVPFRCCEKGVGFLFVCRRQVVRLDHDLFCHDYAPSFWRRKAVASPLPLGAAKLCFSSKNTIKRRAEWAAGIAAAVPRQGASDRVGIGAVLDRKAESDRRVARVHIGRGVGFMIVEKYLADPTIGKTADRADVVQPGDFKRECLGEATVFETAAVHGTPPALSTVSIVSCAVLMANSPKRSIAGATASQPMNSRPRRRAAYSTPKPPAAGSITKSPGSVTAAISRSIRPTGLACG